MVASSSESTASNSHGSALAAPRVGSVPGTSGIPMSPAALTKGFPPVAIPGRTAPSRPGGMRWRRACNRRLSLARARSAPTAPGHEGHRPGGVRAVPVTGGRTGIHLQRQFLPQPDVPEFRPGGEPGRLCRSLLRRSAQDRQDRPELCLRDLQDEFAAAVEPLPACGLCLVQAPEHSLRHLPPGGLRECRRQCLRAPGAGPVLVRQREPVRHDSRFAFAGMAIRFLQCPGSIGPQCPWGSAGASFQGLAEGAVSGSCGPAIRKNRSCPRSPPFLRRRACRKPAAAACARYPRSCRTIRWPTESPPAVPARRQRTMSS